MVFGISGYGIHESFAGKLGRVKKSITLLSHKQRRPGREERRESLTRL